VWGRGRWGGVGILAWRRQIKLEVLMSVSLQDKNKRVLKFYIVQYHM